MRAKACKSVGDGHPDSFRSPTARENLRVMKKSPPANTPASCVDLDKLEQEFIDLEEVERLSYPTYFTAMYEYFGTGEGTTIGIVLGRAYKASDLKRMVNEYFKPYFAAGAQIWPRLLVPTRCKALIPDAVTALIDNPSRAGASFLYSSTFHINYA